MLVFRIAAIAAVGGFLFGYDTGVIGGALLYIKHDLHAASNLAQQSIVASLLVGAVAGALVAGRTARTAGRRKTIMAAGWIYVAGAIASAFSVNLWMLLGARFALGVAVGAASFVTPMYLSEIAPPRIRGAMVTFNQLMLTTGILVAYVADWGLHAVPGNWRWMLGLAALPGIVLALGMLEVPASPRWLAQRGDEEGARSVLRQIHARDDVEDDLRDIKEAASQQLGVRALFERELRPALIVGIGLAVFQQLVGINTVIYYAPTILSFTGISVGGSLASAIFIGLTNVVFTVAAVLLLDRLGRRPLLIFGTAGLCVALTILGAFFYWPQFAHAAPQAALGALLLYIACFAVGMGPVFWLMISEIYPLGVRSAAESTATIANWLTNFVVSFTFLSLIGALGKSGAFWTYAGIGVLAVLFAALRVPETRGRSLEEIERTLKEHATHQRVHVTQ